MLQSALARSIPNGRRLAAFGLLAAALLWGWYAWIFAPTVFVERDRAIADDSRTGITAALQTIGAEDATRARELVVSMRREMPKLKRLDGIETAALENGLQRLEDALRLGTYDVALHRAVVDELRNVQLQLIARGQRTAALAAQSSQRANLMFIALLGVGLALTLRARAPEQTRGLVPLLGRDPLGRLLFDVSPEAVSIADQHERIIAVNAAFCRVTGYDASEAVGRALNFNGSGE
ncbi:MAG TPA: PAS domain-containing protein, partial [Pseudomonadales bacterium]|nr:PAS domain-containing protein [Pseudomonadales bacterium]